MPDRFHDPVQFSRLQADESPVVIWEARTRRAARRGLLKLDDLPAGQALRIRTPSVHTFGMRFALDLVWLSRRGEVLRIDYDVPRSRTRSVWRAGSVLELAAGQARQLDLQVGQHLTIHA